jgi:Tol biopolymer transport system component
MKRLLLLAAPAVLLVTGCGSSGSPRPDLAFVSSRDGAYQLYGMNADGSRQKRLTHEKGDPSTPSGLIYQVDPAWSPNGKSIAFASKRNGRLHLYVMRADGTGTRRLTDTKNDDSNPTWSPDGSELAFQRGPELFVMSADGTHVRPLGKELAGESDPAWSPNGRWIAYVRKQPATEIREIWLVHPDGSGRRQLTHLGASSLSPAWAPNSQRLAFSSGKKGRSPDIYVIGVDGKHQRQLTLGGSEAFEPDWSPNGKEIAFWSDGIFTVDLHGGQQQLTNGEGNDSSPVWRPVQPKSD